MFAENPWNSLDFSLLFLKFNFDVHAGEAKKMAAEHYSLA